MLNCRELLTENSMLLDKDWETILFVGLSDRCFLQGCTPTYMYGLDMCVTADRIWFLRVMILK